MTGAGFKIKMSRRSFYQPAIFNWARRMRRTDPELHARRRREILAAAESCFVKSGFHAASMQDIASAAGVSMGSLYRYFANKEAIIESFAALDSAVAVAAVELWSRSASPLADLRGMMRGMLREAMVPDRAAIIAEIYAESLRNPRLRKLLARHEAIVTGAWAHAITAHRAAGRLGGESDPAFAADLLLGLVDGYANRRLLSVKRLPPAEEEALLAQLACLVGGR